MIDEQPDFELVTRPELNILTYRYCPEDVRQALAMADELQAEKMNTCLNRITKFIQKPSGSEARHSSPEPDWSRPAIITSRASSSGWSWPTR